MGLSDRTMNLISSAQRLSTRKQYLGGHILLGQQPRPKGQEHSGRIRILTSLHYDNRWSYSAINSARSALSNYLSQGTERHTVGTHPLVTKLMRGIFNANPPKTRYSKIWEVGVVLNMLRSWSPITALSLQELTTKMVMLMALVTAQRVQSLSKLSLDSLIISPEKLVFVIQDLIKQNRPGSSGQVFEFMVYPYDERLCIARHIQLYIEYTKSIRGQRMVLLISYKKPHKRVTTQTISRWLKYVLKMAGIDTNVFNSHSTRAAATSAAKILEVPTAQILRMAGWSSERTFQRFYNNPVFWSHHRVRKPFYVQQYNLPERLQGYDFQFKKFIYFFVIPHNSLYKCVLKLLMMLSPNTQGSCEAWTRSTA
ncbi:uncharacterized protein LOC129708389 [Leucoraja erinacea]|uniref:uncharacterized protein LOC129708389 n=1 Tax=Leucoraja erinaceus TaxID=7782 RepID=UPI002454FB63|nr:uncharacterized protein LOC129708389 [Leucoraja erinacea]